MEPGGDACDRSTRLRAAWAVAWRTVAFVVLWGVLAAPALLPLARRLGETRDLAYGRLHLMVEAAVGAALLVASLVMARLVDRRKPVRLGLSAAHLPQDLAAGVLCGALWLAASLLPLGLLGNLEVAPAGSLVWRAVGTGLAVTAVNAFTQELLVHGYLFQVARRAWGGLPALVATSLLNVALHAPAVHGDWLAALNLFLAAAVFGLGLLRTGGLWFPAAAHFTWNGLVGPALGLVLSGRADLGVPWRLLSLRGPAVLTGGRFGVEASVVTTLATLSAVAALAGWRGRRQP